MIHFLYTGDKLYDAWVGALGFTFIAIIYFIYLKIKAMWQNYSAKKNDADTKHQLRTEHEISTAQANSIINTEASSLPTQTKIKSNSFIFLLNSKNKIALFLFFSYIFGIIFNELCEYQYSVKLKVILTSDVPGYKFINPVEIDEYIDMLIYIDLYAFILPLAVIGIGNVLYCIYYLCTRYRQTQKDS